MDDDMEGDGVVMISMVGADDAGARALAEVAAAAR